jgi:flagellar hook-basal body complex protein FliE
MDIPSFGNAMSKVQPGTFVPDIAFGAPKISPLPEDAAAVSQPATASFADTLKGMLSDVNDKVNTSDQNSKDLAMGKTNDLNKVVTSVEEANLSMQFTMAIRNKLMESYQEISRMTV